MIYNKLVRDKIPEIIASKNKKYNIKYLKDDELKDALNNKLLEEVNEFIESDHDIEEMADIFEVIGAILDLNNWTYDMVGQVQLDKVKARGAFDKGIFLIEAEE